MEGWIDSCDGCVSGTSLLESSSTGGCARGWSTCSSSPPSAAAARSIQPWHPSRPVPCWGLDPPYSVRAVFVCGRRSTGAVQFGSAPACCELTAAVLAVAQSASIHSQSRRASRQQRTCTYIRLGECDAPSLALELYATLHRLTGAGGSHRDRHCVHLLLLRLLRRRVRQHFH